jgi:gamma-glutamyltranspeptidase/glutathione hydrolase
LTPAAIQHAQNPAEASKTGGLAVGVPGEPAGLLLLSRRFGRVPLARAAAPAVALARGGFHVTEYLNARIAQEREHLSHEPQLAQMFLPGGSPALAGTRIRRPLLARTLERYGREGERFVNGALATAVARTASTSGGVITANDVRGYRPLERTPLTRPFHGATIVTAPPPSAGGIIMLEALAWLDTARPSQLAHGSSAYDHLLASAFRGGFDDRARYIGDPGTAPSNADALLDPARLARRRATFDPAHAAPPVAVPPPRDHGTTHLCVVDADGMVVSLTTTVNLLFGARVVIPDMDVILNDEIDDFSLATPGNNFGLAVAATNALVPGHRPVSSMTPTIILRDGRPIGCAGAAGGSRITTATAQVVANMIVHGMDPQAAVSAPRVHHQNTPDQLLVEREVPEDVRAGLRARGYTVVETTEPLAAAQAIMVRERNGHREVLAASDPRKNGAPDGD